jgi:hypothetical protein
MASTVTEEDRGKGLIYFDQALRNSPSTHALVIGVGQYLSNRISAVTSPPIAARAMTAWLLDEVLSRNVTGFNNPDRPLCSLAVLLSERPNGVLSELEGAPVPRSTFSNVKNAVRAWISRARAHTDNLLFLFVSSHGESFGRRTAFLLEDYGTDEDDVTAGMSEIEQFVEALSNLDPKNQLLIFDCCRIPTALGLRFDQEFGAKLLNPAGPHGGIARQPHILRSTGLGAEAYGVANAPTLFTQSLLDSLRGLAASPNDRWAIDTYSLGHITARLLGLHVRDGEPLQLPESQLSKPFKISVTKPIDTATVFVSLTAEHDFSSSRIRVMNGATLVEERIGQSGPPQFARIVLPKYQAHTIIALDATGKVIGQTGIEPLPPVAFTELPEKLTVMRSALERDTSAAHGMGSINLSVIWADAPMLASVVATISSYDADTVFKMSLALTPNSAAVPIEVEPGRYAISIAASTGEVRSGEAQAHAGIGVDVQFDLSPAVRERTLNLEISERDVSGPLVGPVTIDDDTWQAAGWTWLKSVGMREQDVVSVEIAKALAAPICRPRGALPDLAGIGSSDGVGPPLFAIHAPVASETTLSITDGVDRRFRPHFEPIGGSLEHGDWPTWAAFAAPHWREIAAVPSLGKSVGQFYAHAWIPELLVTPLAKQTESHSHAIVRTRQWSSLLAFLALRDFERSAIVLDVLMSEIGIRIAVVEKVENPLAAVAGALVAVACGRLEQMGIPEQWVQNLVNWFPGLPDGPVILSRLLLQQRRSAESRARAKALLLQACSRGIPVFSLAVDWLAQGLAAFGDDAETAAASRGARRLAQLSDPTRAFTVLRIPV